MKKEHKKRDILFLLQFFYPEYISSATLPFDTAVKFAEKGLSVDVLCGYPHEYIEKEDIPLKEIVNKVNIHRVKYLQMNRKRKIGRLINYLSLTVAMFFRLFSMKKYRIIFVYSNPPILPLVATWASKLFGCKLIFIAYDLYPEIALKMKTLSEKSIITKIMNYINSAVYQQADAVVALSSEMKKYITENRKIESEKIFVIPNWYKDEYQQNIEKEDNLFATIVKDRIVISYFGNMGVAQDMDIIKEAIRYYKYDSEVCFLLSGHGSKHSEIERMIRDEKIENAYLYGFLKGQDYLDALRVSTCAVVSLEKDLTGLCVPSKTYGYMMQGLPIVAIMNESDIVYDIQKGAGYHVKDNSKAELINVIFEIKRNPQDCSFRGNISRDLYLEKYTPKVCLESYYQLLKDILKVDLQ